MKLSNFARTEQFCADLVPTAQFLLSLMLRVSSSPVPSRDELIAMCERSVARGGPAVVRNVRQTCPGCAISKTRPKITPDTHWSGQVQDALRERIHQTNLARDASAEAIPTQVTNRLIHAFRHGVRVGLSQVARTPGPKSTTKQSMQLADGR